MTEPMVALPGLGAAIPATLAANIVQWALERPDEVPPPIAKTLTLVHHLKEYGCPFFVETGTFLGDAVDAIARIGAPHGLKAITIELSEELHANALRRFAGRANVECLQGDSGALLPEVVARLTGPALFWLDGHYSGGMTARGAEVCPVMRELAAIFASPIKEHVILIDDIRLFGTEGYPSVTEITDAVARHLPRSSVKILNDILRVLPPRD